jgi:hypothetical protein
MALGIASVSSIVGSYELHNNVLHLHIARPTALVLIRKSLVWQFVTNSEHVVTTMTTTMTTMMMTMTTTMMRLLMVVMQVILLWLILRLMAHAEVVRVARSCQ